MSSNPAAAAPVHRLRICTVAYSTISFSEVQRVAQSDAASSYGLSELIYIHVQQQAVVYQRAQARHTLRELMRLEMKRNTEQHRKQLNKEIRIR